MFRSVGREAELAEVCRAVDELTVGRGRPLLVVGEAGIGKTLLIEDAARYASRNGVCVAMTRCPNKEGAPPYWPWSELLGACLREFGPDLLAHHSDVVRADVARLLPGVPVQENNPRSDDDERSRFELFHSVVTVFRRAASEMPVLLVLDDLHWADLSTLKLFEFAAGSVAGLPLLVVGTYRDVEVGSDDLVADVVAGLPGETVRIDLRGVTGDDLASLIAQAGGFDPSPSLVRWTQGHTGGNPLFVNEVVRLLKFERRLDEPPRDLVLPAGVRATIERRLRPVRPETMEALTWAAVCGDEFNVVLLAQASGLSSDTVSQALGVARRLRLVSSVPGRPGCFAFTHGLVAETLREGLLAVDRSRRHLRLAQAYIEDGRGAGASVSEISHHLFEALPEGDPEVAANYAARAADDARRQLAWEDAAQLYGDALEALALTSGDDVRRAELMVERAAALSFADDRATSREAALAAAETARSIDNPELLVRSVLTLAASNLRAGLEGGDTRAIELFELALDRLDPEDSANRATLLARLAREHQFTDPIRSARYSEQVRAIAERTGAPIAVWEAQFRKHLMLLGTPDLEGRLANSSEMVRLSDRIGDLERMHLARILRVTDLAVAGQRETFTREMKAAEEAIDLAHLHSLRWYLSFWEGTTAMAEGRLGQAESRSMEAIGSAGKHGQWAVDLFGIQLVGLLWLQDRMDETEAIVAEASEQFPALAAYRCSLALIHCELGKLPSARAMVKRLTTNDFAAIPRDLNWLTCMNSLAEACVTLNDPDLGRSIYAQLLPYADHHVVVGFGASYLGPVTRLLGRLASVWHDWDVANEHFRCAVAAANHFGAQLWVAKSKLDWAEMLITRHHPGDDDVYRRLADDVEIFLDELKIPWLHRQLEQISMPLPETRSLSPQPNAFRREGDYWTIGYQGVDIRLRDRKGLHDIATLLASPNREIHVLDLEATQGHARHSLGADPAVDATTRNACKRRLRELQDEINEAELIADAGRATRARDEWESITAYLAGAYGLAQRSRRPGDSTEQARKTVWHRIDTSLKLIKKEHPALYRHFERSIRTGTFCTYSPEQPLTWSL